MHPPSPEFNLPMLRRQLEEILAIVKGGNCAPFIQRAIDETAPSVHENNASFAEPDDTLANEYPDSETPCDQLLDKGQQYDQDNLYQDELYDDALVVVTEFGHASPSILQMWLSIDYGRAITILNRLQADGLVSSKGRVRHKAYSLRRSEAGQEASDGRFRD